MIVFCLYVLSGHLVGGVHHGRDGKGQRHLPGHRPYPSPILRPASRCSGFLFVVVFCGDHKGQFSLTQDNLLQAVNLQLNCSALKCGKVTTNDFIHLLACGWLFLCSSAARSPVDSPAPFSVDDVFFNMVKILKTSIIFLSL